MATRTSGNGPRRRHTQESMRRVRRLALSSAQHLVGKKRYEAAASILENYIDAHPDSPGQAEVLRALGRVRLAQGQPREAARLFERALQSLREDLQSPAQASAPAKPAVATLATTD